MLGINCKAKSLIPVGKSPMGLIPYDWSDSDDDTILDHIDDDDTETIDLGTVDLSDIDLEAT